MGRDDETPEVDYRFSMANERTYLAWVRTAVALIAGGIVAAKALEFRHEVWKWVVAAPPILGGAALAVYAPARWRAYERAMRAGRELPIDPKRLRAGALALAAYGVLVLVAAALDG